MAVLRAFGFVTLRAPGSGTGDFDLPDVLAASHGVVLVTEAKAGGPPRNVRCDEVAALRRVADGFLGTALITARYKGDRTFYLARPSDMDWTPSDNYSIPGDEADLPWSLSLPYGMGDDGVEPIRDDGCPVAYTPDGTPLHGHEVVNFIHALNPGPTAYDRAGAGADPDRPVDPAPARAWGGVWNNPDLVVKDDDGDVVPIGDVESIDVTVDADTTVRDAIQGYWNDATRFDSADSTEGSTDG